MYPLIATFVFFGSATGFGLSLRRMMSDTALAGQYKPHQGISRLRYEEHDFARQDRLIAETRELLVSIPEQNYEPPKLQIGPRGGNFYLRTRADGTTYRQYT